VRHLNEALGLFLIGAFLMIIFAALVVRWLLARKEKRKSRGAGYHIDISRKPSDGEAGERLGSPRDRR
jgi:hypothetical protein